MKKALATLLIAILPGSPCWAVPQLLNFQGRIHDSEEGHEHGDHDHDDHGNGRDMIFRIFNDATGGTALFTEAHTGQNAVAVKNGFFNVLIGAITQGGITTTVFDGADKYIELQVGQEVLPRQRVTSVGYAFRSLNADFALTAATASYASTAGSLAGPNFSLAGGTLTVGNVVASSAVFTTFVQMTELKVGDGLDGVNVSGPNNRITFTQPAGTPLPLIRTTAALATSGVTTGNIPLMLDAGASGTLNLNDASSGNVLLARGGGFVGVGLAAPTTLLDVNGATTFRNSSTWTGLAVAPPVSAAGQGSLYFDQTSQKFLVSQNGGAYAPVIGATGPAGVTGPSGVAGVTGTQGLQGVTGATGPQGLQGITGVQGMTGATGLQGYQGVTGIQGLQGVTGSTGIQGVQGATGAQGVSGATGVANYSGPVVNYVSKVAATNPTLLGNSLIYDNGTNVGVGVANPGFPLEINGTTKIDGAGNTLLLDRAGTAAEYMTFNSGGGTAYIGLESSAGGVINGNGDPYALAITPAQSRKLELGYNAGARSGVAMTIDTTGNVGVQQTTPVTAFHVHGAAGIPSLSADSGGIMTIGSASGVQLQSGGDLSNNMWLQTKSAANVGTYYNLLLNPLGGYVGIGTNAPAFSFDVNGRANSSNGWQLSPPSGGVGLFWLLDRIGLGANTPNIESQNANGLEIGAGNAPVAFYTNQAERMRVAPNGNIGIGTTNPGFGLDVQGLNGYINAKAGLCIGGSCVTSVTGLQGPVGATGVVGAVGATGPQGATGPAGGTLTSASAYSGPWVLGPFPGNGSFSCGWWPGGSLTYAGNTTSIEVSFSAIAWNGTAGSVCEATLFIDGVNASGYSAGFFAFAKSATANELWPLNILFVAHEPIGTQHTYCIATLGSPFSSCNFSNATINVRSE